MLPIIRLLRVRQWVKNLFLFVPNFFAGELFNLHTLTILAAGALAFSFVASAVYVLNDLRDKKADQQHPKKCMRPLACGAVSTRTATILIILFASAGMSLALLLSATFFYLLLAYVIINLAYSFGLKHIAIVDLFLVALGFLLRIYSGGILGDVPISHWLSIMILLLALFLVLAKRRDDLLLRSTTGESVRRSSRAYNLEFVNSCLTIFSAVIVVAYIMYTVSPDVKQRFNSDYLFITSAFVIAGIMRYLQITFVEQNSGFPTSILFRDKFILFTIIGWIVAFYIIIYTPGL